MRLSRIRRSVSVAFFLSRGPRVSLGAALVLAACKGQSAPPAPLSSASTLGAAVTSQPTASAPPLAAPLAAPSSSVAPQTVADLGPALAPIRDKSGVPALAGAVMAGDQLIAIGAVGVRKSGDPTPVTVDDEWHLGSDTKAMTATLAALYVDAGKLSWTTTLAEAFPAWASTMDPAYRAVTIEMLLSHFGGAPGDVPRDIWAAMWKATDSHNARLAAVQAMLKRPPQTPPGTKFVYANAGYMIVGAALEVLTGTTWEDLMRTQLFAPLGMGSCGFGSPATPGQVDQPWGHTRDGGKLTPVPSGPEGDNPPSMGPAGTVHCSLRDWGKFAAMHLAGARGESHFVSAASFEKLHRPWPGSDYAEGWIVTSRPWGGGTVLTHSGSNTMFFATVWIAPKINRVFMAATNSADDAASKAVDDAFGPLIDDYSK